MSALDPCMAPGLRKPSHPRQHFWSGTVGTGTCLVSERRSNNRVSAVVAIGLRKPLGRTRTGILLSTMGSILEPDFASEGGRSIDTRVSE